MNGDKPTINRPFNVCGKCGRTLSALEISRDITMCKLCRDAIFHERQDNEGWF